MRRQFDKRIVTGAGLVAERNRFARMERPIVAQMATKKRKEKASSFFKILSAVARFFKIKRKLAPWEIKAVEAAQAKRERRRQRNIRWWSNDPGWEYYNAW